MIKLVYFKMRALAEAPQMLMRSCGIEYTYLMSWDHFGDQWSNVKAKVPFKQLPILELDNGTQIGQSIAILNYIEKIAGLSIPDPYGVQSSVCEKHYGCRASGERCR